MRVDVPERVIRASVTVLLLLAQRDDLPKRSKHSARRQLGA